MVNDLAHLIFRQQLSPGAKVTRLRARRALPPVLLQQLLRFLGRLRYPDDSHALAGQLVVVIPLSRVEAVADEVGSNPLGSMRVVYRRAVQVLPDRAESGPLCERYDPVPCGLRVGRATAEPRTLRAWRFAARRGPGWLRNRR